MVKKNKPGSHKMTTWIWATLFYKIFFWCSQNYYSFFPEYTPISGSGPWSNIFARIFYFSNKLENEIEEEENSFSRKIFFSLFIENQKIFISPLFTMGSFSKIIKQIIKRNHRSCIMEKFFFNIISTERFSIYTNRFYIKKTKHSDFVEFFTFFSRNYWSPFVAAFHESLSLIIWILTSVSCKNLKDLNMKIVLWQKRIEHDSTLSFQKFFKKGLELFFNKLTFFPEFSLKFKEENRVTGYSEFMFVYELNILDYFFSRALGKLDRFLTQRTKVIKTVICLNFIFVFFYKNLESYEDIVFLLQLKCLFTEKDINRLIFILSFISFKLKILERVYHSIVIFSFSHQNYFSSKTRKSFWCFPPRKFYGKKKSNIYPTRLGFLENLRCYDSIPKKIQILLFSGSENLFFLKEKKSLNDNLESISFQDYSFRIKKIGYYIFLYFFLFEIGNIGIAENLKKGELEKLISKYFFALKDCVLGKSSFQIDLEFIFSKLNSVQELIIALFNKKNYLELQMFYFETRLSTISNIYYCKKPLFRLLEAQINSELTIGKKFRIKEQFDISRTINCKFFSNLRNWFFYFKCKKKKLKKDYFKDTVTSKIIFTRVILMGNNKLNRTEKGLKFVPISIFRCSRLFSRFFFLEMIKEKQLFWGYSQTRILLESSGFFCHTHMSFFLQVDFYELVILLALSRLQMILKKDLKFFFSQSGNRLSQTVDKLENLGLIKTRLDSDFGESCLVLGRTFFPKARITKIPTFYCSSFLAEDQPFCNTESSDHIYVSEATIVKFLKLEKIIKCEDLLVKVRKKFQQVFFSDPRGIILQGRILSEKSYIEFLCNENSYRYVFD